MDTPFFRPGAPEDAFGITIDRNGRWFHHGAPMMRESLPRLFSRALHYDPKAGEYWLITPHEQGRITVEDVPYIITDFQMDGGSLTLTTNLGHAVAAGAEHRIFCKAQNGLAYVPVANGVCARLNRPVREALIHIALEAGGYDALSGHLILTAGDADHVIAIEREPVQP